MSGFYAVNNSDSFHSLHKAFHIRTNKLKFSASEESLSPLLKEVRGTHFCLHGGIFSQLFFAEFFLHYMTLCNIFCLHTNSQKSYLLKWWGKLWGIQSVSSMASRPKRPLFTAHLFLGASLLCPFCLSWSFLSIADSCVVSGWFEFHIPEAPKGKKHVSEERGLNTRPQRGTAPALTPRQARVPLSLHAAREWVIFITL